MNARRARAARRSSIADQQGEALKELGAWSRWLVTVETALLAGIVAAGWLGGPFWILLAALTAFTLSLASATMVLGAIPDALQKRPIRDGGRGDIYSFVFRGWQLRRWAFGQHVMAGVGLACLFAWAVSALLQNSGLRPELLRPQGIFVVKAPEIEHASQPGRP